MASKPTKSVRDKAPDEVKKLILNQPGEGAQNDYKEEKSDRKDTQMEKASTAKADSSGKAQDNRTLYKHDDNPESKDSNRPYEDTLMPEVYDSKPLSSVVKKPADPS